MRGHYRPSERLLRCWHKLSVKVVQDRGGSSGEVDEHGWKVGEGVRLGDRDGGGDAAQIDTADDHAAGDGQGAGAVVAQGGGSGVHAAVDGDVRPSDDADG